MCNLKSDTNELYKTENKLPDFKKQGWEEVNWKAMKQVWSISAIALILIDMVLYNL